MSNFNSLQWLPANILAAGSVNTLRDLNLYLDK